MEVTRGGGADQLQDQLRDLLCLAVVGDHLRWVLRGEQIEDLGEWLAGAVTEWRRCADEVARFMVTAGIPPDGRVRSLAADIPFNWVPDGWVGAEDSGQMVASRLRRVADWTRTRGSECSEDQKQGLFDKIDSCLQAQIASLLALLGHAGVNSLGDRRNGDEQRDAAPSPDRPAEAPT